MASEKIWITWTGGDCPVPNGTLVEVRHRDGDELVGMAGIDGSVAEDWQHDEGEEHDGDIIAFRLVEA